MEYVVSSDEFELEFPELSRAGASQFSSWKRAVDFFLMYSFLAKFFLSCFYKLLNQKINLKSKRPTRLFGTLEYSTKKYTLN